MTDKRWNDDIAYIFSTHRVFMKIFGLWPLQTRTIFTEIRCGLCIIIPFTILPLAIMDLLWSQDAGTNIECIMYISEMIFCIIKTLCIIANQKKLGMNINGAIDDWLSARNNKATKKIMKKYAVKSRRLTSTMLFLICGYIAICSSIIMFQNLKQILFTDDLAKDNTTNCILLFLSGPLCSLITTGPQYAIILVIQIIQLCVAVFIFCITDCFFFIVTIHLISQLEILKNQLKSVANKPDTEVNYRKKFISLLNRHTELTELYQNLEDTFHFILLSQVMETTILIALIGLRLNIYFNKENYMEAIKNIIIIIYLLIQSLVYACCGGFLQNGSEDLSYAIYSTTWYTLPLGLMKDVSSAMTKLSIPFRLTAGKFFCINCGTMTYVLTTVISYVSVLRTLKAYE